MGSRRERLRPVQPKVGEVRARSTTATTTAAPSAAPARQRRVSLRAVCAAGRGGCGCRGRTGGEDEGARDAELALRHDALDVLDRERHVQRAKGEERAKVLRLAHRVEAHHGDAGREERAVDEQRRVRDVEARGEAAAGDGGEAVEGQEVDDKGVAAPGEDHVAIRRRERHRPRERARVQRLHRLSALVWCDAVNAGPAVGARKGQGGRALTKR